MKTFLDCLLVGCGSFCGGVSRFLVARVLPTGGGAGFPWATFAVNVAGCLLLGLVAGLSGRAGGIDPRLRLLLATTTSDPHLIVHATNVRGCMEAFARHFGQPPEEVEHA